MLDPFGPCTPIQKDSHAVTAQTSSALFLGFPLILGFPLTKLRRLFASLHGTKETTIQATITVQSSSRTTKYYSEQTKTA